jgi:hypothetical protein
MERDRDFLHDIERIRSITSTNPDLPVPTIAFPTIDNGAVVWDKVRTGERTDEGTCSDPRMVSVPKSEPASTNSDGANHNVVLPPARDSRPHHRPSTRRTDGAQSVLRRLQIVDSTVANPPVRQRRVLSPSTSHRTLEENVSRSSQLPRSLRAQSLYS